MRFEGVNFSIGIIEKLSIVVVGLISIVISYIFYRLYLKKNSLSKKNDFYKYFIIILLSELFILIATPLWLYDLYKIPIYFSIVSRLIRFALLFTFKLLIVVIISNVIEAISTKKISNIKVDKIEN
jgi:hypothetical protein